MMPELLRLTPGPPSAPLVRSRGRPHGAAALAEARRLVETTALSYRAIERLTGVPRATLSRRVLEEGWLRLVPSAALPMPTPEGARRARRGELAERLLRAAERQVIRVEMNPDASPPAFQRAVRLLKLAQTLDRPGQPRNRVPKARRLKRRADSARPPAPP